MDLCRDIFEKGMKIKPALRKGVWLHLVGVFHPDMKTREERELYFNKLKRVYDSLRGTEVMVQVVFTRFPDFTCTCSISVGKCSLNYFRGQLIT